ncbi:MAG TPA: c-type cytochrome [Thermoanaerobaculia bacterium]|nr:c-type cytochrome [Thermoanaerobaculia bacterium]
MKRSLVMLVLLAAACKQPETPATPAGDAKRGQQLMTHYGCNSCHLIPGVSGPRGMVGPPLDHMAGRQFIAGKFPNTPPTMSQWLQNPQSLDPRNAMPNLGVTANDARDMAAYLSTLQ